MRWDGAPKLHMDSRECLQGGSGIWLTRRRRILHGLKTAVFARRLKTNRVLENDVEVIHVASTASRKRISAR